MALKEAAEMYAGLEATASARTECGVRETRCPSEVPVVQRMGEAAALFGR